MPVTTSTSASVTRINLSGEYDFSSQDELKKIFEEALNVAAPEIQLNMQNTAFIDSSVIRILLKLHETAKLNKKKLIIVNCNKRIYEIFAIGGFDQIFNIQ